MINNVFTRLIYILDILIVFWLMQDNTYIQKISCKYKDYYEKDLD